MFLVDYGPFMALVDTLMKDGHIKYHLGSKPALTTKPEDIKKSDCSGFVRYLMHNATGGRIEIGTGGGTWWENKWCKDQKLEVVDYSTAATADGVLRIAFIHGGAARIGHVWLVLSGRTIECHSSVGADQRPWDTPKLKDQVDVCYKLAVMIAADLVPWLRGPVAYA
jgi:cell wall-associated NlpC family hydrolase